MKIDGSCHCGHLRYEAEVDPEGTVICHCTDCQVLTGSAFALIVPARGGSFRLLAGEPTLYVKTAESGNRRVQAFCPLCGTRLYSGPDSGRPGHFGLRVGTIRQRAELTPKEQIWCRSACAWVGMIDRIEQRLQTE